MVTSGSKIRIYLDTLGLQKECMSMDPWAEALGQ